MVRRLHLLARVWAACSALSVLFLLAGLLRAEEPAVAEPTRLPIWPPQLLTLAQAAQPEAKETKQPAAPPAAKVDQAPDTSAFSNQQDTSTSTAQATLASPNMIGDLLNAYHSVSFFVNRSAGAGFINSVGSTSLVNPAVADNNSPVPMDRVYFRYNHFANALAVAGASSQAPVPIAPGVFQGFTTSQFYNSDMYTFGLEKTFFDRRVSLELRLPFYTSLSPNLDLSYGQLTSSNLVPSGIPGVPGSFYQTAATPANTLGNSSTQFGDITLIFKWLFYRNDWLWLSGGLAGTAPTGPDSNVRVTDFLDTIRFREFHIRNQTWSASPFLSALLTPTDRLFGQAFLQYDIPLNDSAITYSETVQQTPTAPLLMAGNGTLAPPFTVRDHIHEQSLLHVDLGTGYWLYRDRQARWLTGFAPSTELHYTTTLQDADVVTLPGDMTAHLVPAQHRFVTNPPPPAPTVGNLRNRVDILDLTLGTTFEFASRTRLATAFAIPLRGADNRTFDWEFLLQLNYYYGAPQRLPPPTF
jgi:hypothetical protein